MAAVAAGRVAVLSAVVVAVAPLLLASVARADCFYYCFKNCVANDKSMTDYCNYACDKTCEPGSSQQPLLAAGGGDMGCQLSCARTSCNRLRPDCKAMETCFEMCYDGCKTKTQSQGWAIPGTCTPSFLHWSPTRMTPSVRRRSPTRTMLSFLHQSPTRTMPSVLLLRQSRKMMPSGHLGRRPTRTSPSIRDRHPTWTATSTRSRTASSPRQSRTKTTASRHRRSMLLLRLLCNNY